MRYVIFILTVITVSGCATKESRCEKAAQNQSKIILSHLPKIAQKAAKPSEKRMKKQIKECVAHFDGAYVDCIARAKGKRDLALCVKDRAERAIKKGVSKGKRKVQNEVRKRALKDAKRKVKEAVDKVGQ